MDETAAMVVHNALISAVASKSITQATADAARREFEAETGEPAILTELRRPFAPSAIKFKIQATWPKGAMVVAHLDARLVIERLNHVCGLDWSDAYREHPAAKHLWCDLTVQGVTRSDVGQGDDGKAAVSDALKRAAVHFGIGVSVYAMSRANLNVGDEPGQLRTRKKKGHDGSEKETPILDARTEGWLREKYGQWLEAGGKVFGEPLEHGDEVDFAGVDEDPEPPADPPPAPRDVKLGPAVEAVLERAEELEHRGIADREAAETALEDQPAEFVEAWVKERTQWLDAYEADKAAREEES